MAGDLVPYKAAFLRAAVDGGPLKFGTFTLKSGRVSPYFFNAGEFYRADLLAAISTAFGETIAEADKAGELGAAGADMSKPAFDVVFGPAYKGIPLATAAVSALATLDPVRYGHIGYAFDRKEAKDHGEGGNFVGAPLAGKRVLVVDDVITAGTAKREAVAKIRAAGGEVVAIVVALDRMETLPDTPTKESALGALKREFGLPILSILTLDDIVAGMRSFATPDDLKRTEAYRAQYKAEE
ncbi:orotate phosphoribosyltransferase [Grosmannia clavigera kw1407]|uniref:Orotate phosphoribosyltransferase n=1 Tax=Grosmannia clavigera (strain kw1407 / UAMH 11150) TaxID=655863 RepID=F0X8W5_GROCL|nr:orotate phosphoribosyltransferase [Grosmannia clavigera kw1407]EFX05296.1 orotate phosphoribosyltransferase [Grosmannia clavigera kw1407]